MNKDSKDLNCSEIIGESDSPVQKYKELIDLNHEIKVNLKGNKTELFISGSTASNDLSDFTVSAFLWPVYCCKNGEIIIITITQKT